jgi:hypothetical protein
MSTFASRSLAGLALAASLCLPSAAAAQNTDLAADLDPSNTRGFFLHVRGGGYGVGFEDDRDGTGSGLGLRMGWGISERVTLFAGMEGGEIGNGDGFQGLPQGDAYGLLYLDAGARIHFRTAARLVPFVEAAANIVGVWFDDEQNEEAQYGGLSASLGGGILYFVTPRVGLEGSALFNAGGLMTSEIGGVERDEDIALAGVRLQVGLSVYPNR